MAITKYLLPALAYVSAAAGKSILLLFPAIRIALSN